MDERTLREDVAACMRRLYDRRLTTCSGGNVSARLGDRVLITPSGLDKGRLTGEQIVAVGPDGRVAAGGPAPSMETGMHLAVYRARPDAAAIVHGHPTVATAFTATGRRIDCRLAGESRALLGEPAPVPYALMGTPELAEAAAAAAARADVLLMANHGVLAVGRTLHEAFDRIEVLEEAARMTLVTALLGDARPLGDREIAAIDALFGRSASDERTNE